MQKSNRSNTSRFVALPVGQGGCFYYNTNGTSVLVDGGKTGHGLGELICRHVGDQRLDVVVCTHNDSDHANGILGLLDSGFPCREVWLPGSWTARLEDLLNYPEKFMAELISNIRDAEDPLYDAPSSSLLEWIGSRVEVVAEAAEGESSTEKISHVLENSLENDELPIRSYPVYHFGDGPDSILIPLGSANSVGARLVMEGLAAASRIANIAKAAYANGARIRWFQHGAANRVPPRGDDVIRGVNCGEILRVYSRPLTALMYLALSVANKESLVFQTRSVGVPGVLFTADSDLAFSDRIDWGQHLLITSPHHGSESNRYAYERFTKEVGPATGVNTWIRSDGRFRSRPGASYLQQPSRYCTRCRAQDGPPQRVEFNTSRGSWKKSAMLSCVCTVP